MKRTIAAFCVACWLPACSTAESDRLDVAPAPVNTLAGYEKAVLQDPFSPAPWHRLASALDAEGLSERAAQARRQAGILERHDLRADIALVQSSETGPATRLIVRADGLLELRRVGVALEIRNGNGVRGMARSLARRLDDAEVEVVRLSNHPGFAIGSTLVEYHGEVEEAARQLALRVGARQIVPAAGAMGRANVRILLGHDLKIKKPPRRAAMEESPARETISAS